MEYPKMRLTAKPAWQSAALPVVALLVAGLLGLHGRDAAAEPRQGKIKGKGDGNIRVNDADAKAIQDLGQQDIEGRMHKPSVFYVLARSEVQYAGIEFKQNFVDRIVKGALRRPF